MNKIIMRKAGILLVIIAMIFAGLGLTSDSYGATAKTIKVYVTISNKGDIPVAAGKTMANVPVTVTSSNGKTATVDAVMKAVHKAYKKNGYASSEYVTKLWGVKTNNTLFFINNTACTSGVKTEKAKNGDYITASVNKDDSYYSDYYTYMNKKTTTVKKGNNLKLTVKGYPGMMGGESKPVSNLQIGIVTSKGFKPLEGVTTDGDGNVVIPTDNSILKSGKTYYLTAKGTVKATATDWSTNTSVEVDAPIIAPVSKVVVSKSSYTAARISAKNYLMKKVKNPTYGNEWVVLGLSRDGAKVPSGYYGKYAKNIGKKLQRNNGSLNSRLYGDFSKVALAYTSIGKKATNISGYNLVKMISDVDQISKQGISGPIWALIALDSGKYESESRQQLIDKILSGQVEEGGFKLTGDKADVDITAMATQALSKYQNDSKVKEATDKALTYLSECQQKDGTYLSYNGTKTSETISQVIVALTEMGINPSTDERFIKNGKSTLDGLMTFYKAGSGFKHVYKTSTGAKASVDNMATEQAYYALVAYNRFIEGKTSLYSIK